MARCTLMRLFPTTLFFALAAIAAGLPDAAAAQGIRLTVVPAESEARYRVRERLAEFEFPNDAVGVTREITGVIVMSDGGEVDAASRFEVDLRTLKSDREMRDGYIQRRTLETEAHPFVVFAPTAVDGLAFPVPTSGTHAFKLIGQMTLHGVTKEAVWDAELEFSADGARGTVTTDFSFGDYNLTIPRLARLISVTDNIRLELDLVLERVDG